MVEKISEDDDNDIYDNFNPSEDVYEFSSVQHAIKMNETDANDNNDLIKDYYSNYNERSKKLSCYQSVRFLMRSHVFHAIIVTLVSHF